MRSDLLLRVVALAIALALLVVVRGEKRVTSTFALPVTASVPEGLVAAAALPTHASVTVSGPWARLRTLDLAGLGPLRVELSSAGPGLAAWYVRPEALRLPRGVRVDAVHPSQGTVELRRGPTVVPSTPDP